MDVLIWINTLAVLAAVTLQTVLLFVGLRRLSEALVKMSEEVRHVAEMEDQTQRLILQRLPAGPQV